MNRALLACALASVCAFSAACAKQPEPAKSPPYAANATCSADDYRRLAFWIGEWDVTSDGGKREGTNVIAQVEGGCAIEERWTEATQGTGRSLFYFDASIGRWKQVWVTSEGGWKEKVERDDAPAGSIAFEGEVPRPAGGVARDRTTLTPLADGRVRQVIEQSIDGGATWKRWEGIYTRKAASPACSAAEHRQFDFWIGDWQLVVRTRSAPGADTWVESRATNEIRATYGGCAIEEHFRAEGPDEPWSGHSVSTYAEGKWRQTWVDDQGSYMTFVGRFSSGEMILDGEPMTKDGKSFRMRMVFTAITKEALTWRWERTDDDGAHFRPTMTIEYARRP